MLLEPKSSWKNVFIAFFIFLIIGAFLAFLKHSESHRVMSSGFSGKPLVLSAQSEKELIDFMNREPSVIAVSTISISLTRNIIEPTFFESKNKEFKDIFEAFRSNRTTYSPLLSNDRVSNIRITSIINGNFTCGTTADTPAGRLFAADKFAPIICSMAVSPAYDEGGQFLGFDFVGFINIYLNVHELSDVERERLGKEAVRLSVKIYKRDIQSQKK